MRRCTLFLSLLLFASVLFAGDLVKVTRVIDGDTFETDRGQKVRLIGVDAPETVHPSKPVEHFGKEASEYTRGMLEGQTVRLEYDQQRIDKYGRVLAYVYLDTIFFNARLIQNGYAHAYTLFPFKYLEDFRQYERTAREKGAGLWGDVDVVKEGDRSPSADSSMVFRTATGKKYHRDGCRYLSKSKIPVSLTEVAALGLGPCSVCNPPAVKSKLNAAPSATEDTTVYVTKTGSKYHRGSCRYLSRSKIPIKLSEAKLGYTPCSVCNPPR
jgi:micrococcal nuclease